MSLPVLVARERIVALEQALQEMPQAWHETVTHFCTNQAARVLYVAAGTVFTGAIHNVEFFTMLAAGRVRFMDTNGGEAQEIEAPYLYVSKPGAKRAFAVLEDAILINFYSTQITDPDEIVRQTTAETFETFDQMVPQG